jgi:type I restriction enzyme S subunit
VNNIVDGKILWNELRYISKEDDKVFAVKCKPRKGDILFGKAASVGKIALVDTDLDFNVWSPLAVIRCSTLSRSQFVYFALQTSWTTRQIALLTNSSSQGNIGMTDIAQIKIFLPPLKEQEAIAEALSDSDAAIESLDALIAKKRDVKQATMQQLLSGRTRLPGFNADWKEVFLGDIARVKTGSRNNQDKVAEGLYPFYVRSAHVESIDSYSYDTEAILIPGEGGVGEIFHYTNAPHEVHQRVYRVSDFTPDTYPKFVFFYLRSFFGAHAMRNTVKATVDSLRLPTFLEFDLLLPPLMEQKAIAETLSAIDDELEALTEQVSKLRMVKEGMMQDLLTGKVRLV